MKRSFRGTVRSVGTLALLAVGCSSEPEGASQPEATPPKQFTWTTATPCPLPRFEANGVVVGGELWVMGGFTGTDLSVTRRIDIYDVEHDSWRQGPDLPGAETHVAVVNLGGDILVAGGFSGGFTNGRPPPTDAVFRWKAGGVAWEAAPALPYAGAGFAADLVGKAFHLAGGLYVDGNTDSPYHYVWDTAASASWSLSTELPNPRNHGGGATAAGRFYAVGGRHGWDEQASNDPAVDTFDPATQTWTARAPLPVGRSEIGASTFTTSDGRIVVVGGSMNGIMPSDDVDVYDPRTDAWSTLPKLPEKRKGAVARQLGKRIVVTTGSPTSTDPIATTFVGCCL